MSSREEMLNPFSIYSRDSPIFKLSSSRVPGNGVQVFTLDTLHDEICPVIAKKPSDLEDTMFDRNIEDLLTQYGSVKHRTNNDPEGVKPFFNDKTNIFLRDVFPNDSDKTPDGKGLFTTPPCFNSIFFDQAGHNHKEHLSFMKRKYKSDGFPNNLNELIKLGGFCMTTPAAEDINHYYNYTSIFNCDLLMFYTIITDIINEAGVDFINKKLTKTIDLFDIQDNKQISSYDEFLSRYKETMKSKPKSSDKEKIYIMEEISLVCINYIWQRLIHYCYQAIEYDDYIKSKRTASCEPILGNYLFTCNSLKNISFQTIDFDKNTPKANFGSSHDTIGKVICSYFSNKRSDDVFCNFSNNDKKKYNYNTSQQSLCILLAKKFKKFIVDNCFCGIPRGGSACKTASKEESVQGIETIVTYILRNSYRSADEDTCSGLIGSILKFAGDSSHLITGLYIEYCLQKSDKNNKVIYLVSERPFFVRLVHCGKNVLMQPVSKLLHFTYNGKTLDNDYFLYFSIDQLGELNAYQNFISTNGINIENYPGYDFIQGNDFTTSMLASIDESNFKTIYSSMIVIKKNDDYKAIVEDINFNNQLEQLELILSDKLEIKHLKTYKGYFDKIKGRHSTIEYKDFSNHIDTNEKLHKIIKFFNLLTIVLKENTITNPALIDKKNSIITTISQLFQTDLPYFIPNFITELLGNLSVDKANNYTIENEDKSVDVYNIINDSDRSTYLKKTFFQRGGNNLTFLLDAQNPKLTNYMFNELMNEYIKNKREEITTKLASVSETSKDTTIFTIETILKTTLDFLLTLDNDQFKQILQPPLKGGYLQSGGLTQKALEKLDDINIIIETLLNDSDFFNNHIAINIDGLEQFDIYNFKDYFFSVGINQYIIDKYSDLYLTNDTSLDETIFNLFRNLDNDNEDRVELIEYFICKMYLELVNRSVIKSPQLYQVDSNFFNIFYLMWNNSIFYEWARTEEPSQSAAYKSAAKSAAKSAYQSLGQSAYQNFKTVKPKPAEFYETVKSNARLTRQTPFTYYLLYFQNEETEIFRTVTTSDWFGKYVMFNYKKDDSTIDDIIDLLIHIRANKSITDKNDNNDIDYSVTMLKLIYDFPSITAHHKKLIREFFTEYEINFTSSGGKGKTRKTSSGGRKKRRKYTLKSKFFKKNSRKRRSWKVKK